MRWLCDCRPVWVAEWTCGVVVVELLVLEFGLVEAAVIVLSQRH